MKILGGTAVMIGYLLLSGKLFPVQLNAALSSRVYNLTLSIVPGIVIYVAITALLGSTTFRAYSDIVKRKLLRRRST